MAVLSNRLLTFSLKSLEKHNIRGYFRYVICPQTAGAPKGKESPEMWQYALNRIGVKPNQTLHVDDKYEQILGAKTSRHKTSSDRPKRHLLFGYWLLCNT